MLLLALAGCRDNGPQRMSVWGEVTYEGSPVHDGVIVFVPVDGTAGPSTGAGIADGKYRVEKSSGPYAGGTYRVEITASGAERSYSPNASGQGTPCTVREQMIPETFNTKSNLRIAVSPTAGKNQQDFRLSVHPR